MTNGICFCVHFRSEGDKRSRDEQDDEMEEDDEGDRFDVDRPEQFAKVENPRLNVPNVDLPVDQQVGLERPTSSFVF